MSTAEKEGSPGGEPPLTWRERNEQTFNRLAESPSPEDVNLARAARKVNRILRTIVQDWGQEDDLPALPPRRGYGIQFLGSRAPKDPDIYARAYVSVLIPDPGLMDEKTCKTEIGSLLYDRETHTDGSLVDAMSHWNREDIEDNEQTSREFESYITDRFIRAVTRSDNARKVFDAGYREQRESNLFVETLNKELSKDPRNGADIWDD